jgi:hypothetical protein
MIHILLLVGVLVTEAATYSAMLRRQARKRGQHLFNVPEEAPFNATRVKLAVEMSTSKRPFLLEKYHEHVSLNSLPHFLPPAGFLSKSKSAKKAIDTYVSSGALKLFGQSVGDKLTSETEMELPTTKTACKSVSPITQAVGISNVVAKHGGEVLSFTVCGGVYNKMIQETAATAKRISCIYLPLQWISLTSHIFLVCLLNFRV